MNDRVRICMIGAGSMASRAHYPSLAAIDGVEIVGVCEQDQGRLDFACDTYGIAAEGRFLASGPLDYRVMLEKLSPDGVYVIGPPHLMYDIWTWCLSEGLNLYIEKPMGLSIHQARSLAYLAELHGCITQVSHQRRSAPIVTTVREKCLERGPITHAVCEFYKCNIEPYLGARDHMMDDCVHSIDTVRYMCSGEVIDIESQCKRVGVPDINWIGATLHFDNGSTGYVINSWSSGRRVFRVQMHAPGIACDVEVEKNGFLYADGDYDGVELDTKQVAGSDELYVYGGFLKKNQEFINSLKSGRELTSSPFSDALKTMEVAETILAHALLQGE